MTHAEATAGKKRIRLTQSSQGREKKCSGFSVQERRSQRRGEDERQKELSHTENAGKKRRKQISGFLLTSLLQNE
jgi:hypothetical protein